MIAGEIQFFLTRATVMKERRVNEEGRAKDPNSLQFSYNMTSPRMLKHTSVRVLAQFHGTLP